MHLGGSEQNPPVVQREQWGNLTPPPPKSIPHKDDSRGSLPLLYEGGGWEVLVRNTVFLCVRGRVIDSFNKLSYCSEPRFWSQTAWDHQFRYFLGRLFHLFVLSFLTCKTGTKQYPLPGVMLKSKRSKTCKAFTKVPGS